MIIDLFGLTAEEVREKYPAVYQWVLERVKPERDQNNRATYRDNWWIFGEARREWRRMAFGLPFYISTVETPKHRTFCFLEDNVLPDNMLVSIALDDAFYLGVLSSRIHFRWANANGGSLGMYVGDIRYNKTRCFETFPFPDAVPEQQAKIRVIAEKLDAHRKRQQAQYSGLTLTDMYNVLEKLRSGEALNAKEKIIHEQGLVSVLRELHDELDRTVFAAYGWDDLADKLIGLPGATTPLPDKSEAQAEAEEELLCRLVALNHERAAEEARGLIRWLRPEYQNPDHRKVSASTAVITDQAEADLDAEVETVVAVGKQAWPKEMREQVATVRAALTLQPHTVDSLATQFKRSPKAAVQSVLEALEELGMVANDDGRFRLQA
jgi:hypothetical protein